MRSSRRPTARPTFCSWCEIPHLACLRDYGLDAAPGELVFRALKPLVDVSVRCGAGRPGSHRLIV
jgi:hypothetical protein